jgi:hypothetical protein
VDARTCGAPLSVKRFSQFSSTMLSFRSYRAANSTVSCCPAPRNVQLVQQCRVFLRLILYCYLHKEGGPYFYYNVHCTGVETRMCIWWHRMYLNSLLRLNWNAANSARFTELVNKLCSNIVGLRCNSTHIRPQICCKLYIVFEFFLLSEQAEHNIQLGIFVLITAIMFQSFFTNFHWDI